jgi:hypothetical protein
MHMMFVLMHRPYRHDVVPTKLQILFADCLHGGSSNMGRITPRKGDDLMEYLVVVISMVQPGFLILVKALNPFVQALTGDILL